ncbi:hypothetical protein [Priestia filamentosa]|uniref:hypothetical protein n=1 Tax=Priestia filamentosa TaxID=1402861 RepID=UPI000E760810|nr:hypothetical protein [Priestia filamentosa]RJS62972.1 hypothetical protein CJ485_23810 [Priestia filamentosa]
MKDEKNIYNIIIGLLLFVLIAVVAVYKVIDIGDVDILAFLGAIIGGIITLLGVHFTIKSSFYQIQKQKQEDEKDDKERNRSYIIAEEYRGPIDLKGVETGQNSRLILTEYYEEYKKDKSENYYKYIPYYKIYHMGLPEIILDCEANFTLSYKQNPPYSIVSHIGILEKNTNIFIPLLKAGQDDADLHKFQFSYNTIKGERMVYTLDIDNKKEKCYVINNNGEQPEECYSFDLKTSNWIYPNSKVK